MVSNNPVLLLHNFEKGNMEIHINHILLKLLLQ